MNNINIRVVGTANVSQMQGAFSKLQAQIAATNTQLASMVNLSNEVDGAGFARMAQAAKINDMAFRNAVASTGKFEQQQLRVNRATDDYIKKLNAQKLSFRDLMKQRKVAAAAYKEQLAMENMVVRTGRDSSSRGKQLLDVSYAREVSSELDTAAKRMAFFNQQLKSGAHQMVNWGKNTQWAGRQLMVGFTMPIAAAGAAAGVLAYQVDKELTRIAKVYDLTANSMSTATKDQIAVEMELKQLREDGIKTATKAAREYGFAVTDTLAAQSELAATGLQGAALQKSTAEVMRISRLGEMDYQDTVKTTIALQSVFKMSTEQLTDAFNYMNSIENATSLSTQDFAAAIPIAAAPVKEFGGDIKELGILLTAMKSRGIEATEGANAIKAAMQRLGRPSKQIQQEWTALTNTDITKIFKNATSLQDLFMQVGKATENLTDKEKIKAFSGLFGTYQVTRMSAMVEGLKDIETGYGQTADAAKIAQQTTQQWAETAEREITTYQNSIAGQWDTAFQELKGQLSTLGGPFVEIATTVVKGISNIIDAFNSLPGIAKKGIAAVIGIAAVAGPLVMLSGLFGNLLGNGIKFGAMIVGLGAKMNILDAESRAAIIAQGLLKNEFVNERTATQQLTLEIEKLTAAQVEANRVAMQGVAIRNRTTTGPRNVTFYGLPSQLGDGKTVNIANDADRVADAADRAEEADKKRMKHGQAIAASSAVAAGAMITMAATSNETANNIAGWALTASMLLPLFTSGPAAAKGIAMGLGKAKTGIVGMFKGSKGVLGAIGRVATMVGPAGLLAGGVAAVGFGLYKWYQHSEKVRREQELIAKVTDKAQANLLDMTKKWADETGRAYKNYVAYNIEGQKDLGNKERQEYLDKVDQFKSQETSVTNDKGEKKKVSTVSQFNNADPAYQATVLNKTYADALINLGMTADEARLHVQAFLDATGKSISEAEALAYTIANNIGGSLKDVNWDLLIHDAEMAFTGADGEKSAQAAGKEYGLRVSQAIAEAGNDKEEVTKLLGNFTNTMMSEWEGPRKKLADFFKSRGGIEEYIRSSFEMTGQSSEGNKEVEDKIAQLEKMTSSTKAYAQAVEDGVKINELFYESDPEDYIEFSKLSSGLKETNAELSANEKATVASIRSVFGLGDEVKTLNDVLDDWTIKVLRLDKSQRTAAVNMDADIVQSAKGLFEEFTKLEESDPAGGLFGTLNDVAKGFTDARFKESLKPLQALVTAGINMDKLDAETKKFIDDLIEAGYIVLPEVSKKIKEIAGDYQVNFVIDKQSTAKMYKQAMTDVQQEIADSYSDALDASQEKAMDSRQAFWDRKEEAQQKTFDRETEAQERAFDRQTKKLDTKWEKRKDKATQYWDSRIENINSAIKAEQKAEEIRQKMFDAEMQRISKLNESMNRNIDFNIALNEGNLDEAAKIRNDAFAAATNNALQNARDAGSDQSDARVENLQKGIDLLEQDRDAYMKNLDKKEEAEKNHLKRSQERQAKSLKAQQDMQSKALQQRTNADINALKATQEAEKKSLQQRLALFMNYIAANKSDLVRHMADVGLTYKGFGQNVLHPEADKWGSWYGKAMKQSLRASALQLQSDAMWAELGQATVLEMVKAMGFKGKKQFKKFIGLSIGDGANGSGSTTAAFESTHHTGGLIGSDPSSRRGVARTNRGLHSSEELVRAQKGEFMVNRKSAASNIDILRRINNGETFGTDVGVGGAGLGMPSVPLGFIARGVIEGIKNNVQKMKAGYDAENASYSGVAGNNTYNLPGVKPWVLEAAQYLGNKFNIDVIGGVGSRGRKSEHPLGLALDFMTSDNRGTALANEVVRINDALDAMYVIWRQRINSFDGRGWRAMADRGSPTENHMDHVHVSFKSSGKTGDLPSLGGGIAGWFQQGTGGTHRPVKGGVLTQGLHYNNAVDFGVPRGTPVYAYADGVVTSSRDIAGPLPSDRYHGDGPYGSYGRVIEINHGGFSTLYAHLSSRYAQTGQQVKGGAKIGASGNTGNSSGPHLHFGMPGARMPAAFLKKGGTVKKDGTPAVLHKDERVLTAPLTKKLDLAVDAMYNGRFGIGGAGGGKKKKKGASFGAAILAEVAAQNSGDSWTTLMNQLAAQQSRNPAYNTPAPVIPTAWLMNTPFTYPEQMASAANSPHTWFNYSSDDPKPEDIGTSSNTDFGSDTDDIAGNLINDAAVLAGSKFTAAIANLNTKIDTPAAQTVTDVKKLIGMSDIITLTEMANKVGPVRDFLQSKGWGLFAGTSKADKSNMSTIAYNKAKYSASEGGTQKLGDKMGNFLGGREYRYANYLKLRNKATGGSFWQIAAHTVPTSGPNLKGKRLEMYNEQWGALETLIGKLGRGGLPVFLGGDLNNSPGQKGWRLPGGLNSFSGRNVDWILSNPKLVELLSGQAINGMHTDHAGAWLAKYKIPSLSKGAMDVRFDDTLANLHAGEAVLTKDINNKFRQGVENFANGGNNQYNLNMNITEPGASADEIANRVIVKLERKEARRPGSRRNR